jgi:hypothetical protein
MNSTQIEQNLQDLMVNFSKETFIYDFLRAYGLPKASITRLQKGSMNLSDNPGEVSWKKKVFFKEEFEEDLHTSIVTLSTQLKYNQRFVIVTDYKLFLAIDTKTMEKLDIPFDELPKHFDFFLPWAGIEKAQHHDDNPADVKAAEKMAKLFDVIKRDNPDETPEFMHWLNVFLSRLLFCFFAEDTNLFKDAQFTNALDSHTQEDGSDLYVFFENIFEVFNTPEDKRDSSLAKYITDFKYVNGGLFSDSYPCPNFSRRSRAAILACGDQDWSAINPDIFGSMFQAVIGDEQRGNLGQHYTSVPNIMKVIKPLFLDELYEEFEKIKEAEIRDNARNKRFDALLERIYNLKIFDPACGSGNFLIIAYKELRILEMKIFKEAGMMVLSRILLSQFYGIEIDDFAVGIAKLALWLAEHQMNVEFFNEFGRTNDTLPLREAGRIVCDNACLLNWEEVCPKNEDDEIYILGNPPYLGARVQGLSHKENMQFVFNDLKGFNNLDYISCWFFKASKYIEEINAEYAFVTTNSICQGEQVGVLWPVLLECNLEIKFAYQSFKWTNNAKGNAGVTVAIIGVAAKKNINYKLIFTTARAYSAKNINPYLVEGNNAFIQKRSNPLSNIPEMCFGSMANDGGHLLLSASEKDEIVSQNPEAIKYIKKLIGSLELIRGVEKYCIWIEDNELEDALDIPSIRERVNNTRTNRLNSKREVTRKLAEKPYRFGEVRYKKTNSIIVPRVSSERREYVPLDFLGDEYVVSDSAQAIYDAEPYLLGIISSRMHMTWMRTVAGRLKSDYRYSSTLVYNTFPFPPISQQKKEEITQCVFRILAERENHSDKTLAQLYDPDKMPDGLREAHRANDIVIEKCYRSQPFESDEDRLEYLFKLYEKMIEEEKSK